MRRCAERAGIAKHLTSHAAQNGEQPAAANSSVTAEMTERYSVVDHDERTAALRGAFGSALVAPVQPVN